LVRAQWRRAFARLPQLDIEHHFSRNDLLSRRNRLVRLSDWDRTGEIARLLGEVDDALERIDRGTYRTCDSCGGSIERECLDADPCRRVCLECLSSSERELLEADLALAGELQASMVPRGERSMPGWKAFVQSRAAGTVSGDFAGLVRLPGGEQVSFIVGDVSGKGVSAGLLASHLQALLRSLAGSAGPLPRRLERVNRLFTAVTPTQAYATLIWGVVDGDGRGEVVNAGHPPALIVGRNGSHGVESTGVPVGLFPGVRYSGIPVELEPGERIVLYTDGVTESTDAGDQEYGVDALQTLVSRTDLDRAPDEVANRYLADVARHRSGLRHQDDLTLMVLRRDGRVNPARVAGQRLTSMTL
jgi:sigma-B regulation protein RsbU (phosphoserine phosphatase)